MKQKWQRLFELQAYLEEMYLSVRVQISFYPVSKLTKVFLLQPLNVFQKPMDMNQPSEASTNRWSGWDLVY